jgi:predicted hotdog family 3-hydroxylacyl-ACP dehydratase
LLLDRSWIQEHIPHKGGMCLLDEVLSWDLTQAQCRSATHQSAENPLRADGRLGAACGIEYAAQTMAVHGALIASAKGAVAPSGFLASVRGVRLNIDRLDVFEVDLVTSVQLVAGDDTTALYEFSVSADDVVLLSGRAAIAFNVFAGLARSGDGATAGAAATPTSASATCTASATTSNGGGAAVAASGGAAVAAGDCAAMADVATVANRDAS